MNGQNGRTGIEHQFESGNKDTIKPSKNGGKDSEIGKVKPKPAYLKGDLLLLSPLCHQCPQ
jgi:hypothetical protein